MYTPRHYRLEDDAAIRAMIARWPFATVATVLDGEPIATHIPVLMEGDHLVGHVARPNPVWRAIAGGAKALAIFHGPHAYVSPAWYTEPRGEVPTWNYGAIHVTGRGIVFEDRERLQALVDRLTAHFDPNGFRVDWEDRRVSSAAGIVGIGSRWIASRQGEAHQNKTLEDRRRVVQALDHWSRTSPRSCAAHRISRPREQTVRDSTRRYVVGSRLDGALCVGLPVAVRL
jgi:transcriptional regulator